MHAGDESVELLASEHFVVEEAADGTTAQRARDATNQTIPGSRRPRRWLGNPNGALRLES